MRLSLGVWAGLLGGLAVSSSLLVGYGLGIEPFWPEVTRLTLTLPHLPRQMDGLTLLQISDIHAGHLIKAADIRRIVALCNAQNADLIVITGDMLQDHRGADDCARELSALWAPLGVYAIMGNHERYLPPALGEYPFRDAGLTVLCNQAHPLERRGEVIWLIGLDDILMRRGDLEQALRCAPPQACKIALIHEPDYADMVQKQLENTPCTLDLQLSGHTHGGQIRLPGVGPLLLPVLGRKYPAGLYRLSNMWLYTHRGVGMASPPIRLGCRPELALFTLKASDERQRRNR